MGSFSPFGRRSLRNKQQMYGNMEEFPVTNSDNSALFGLVGFQYDDPCFAKGIASNSRNR